MLFIGDSVGASIKWALTPLLKSGGYNYVFDSLSGRCTARWTTGVCRPGDGLFPAPKEIEFTCSCPNWASMCKHVAAVLYGIGARLDHQPELLFALRKVDQPADCAQECA